MGWLCLNPKSRPGAGLTRNPRGFPTSWGIALLAGLATGARAGEDRAATRFRDQIQPVLEERCYACHGNGIKKGGLSLDPADGEGAEDKLVKDRALWSAVLKNVRAGVMPPAGKPRPSGDEVKLLADWVKFDVLGIDRNDPDPGRVTLRRLNRVEYRNTIRDLMGIDFRTDEEFPPDDTGYGFDNVGDVLTLSPLLLEKYVQAAEVIVAQAVPTVAKVVGEQTVPGLEFLLSDGEGNGDKLSFYKEASVARTIGVKKAGDYQLALEVVVDGQFDFDPGRCTVSFTVDGEEKLNETFDWADNKKFKFTRDLPFDAGEHRLAFHLEPLTPVEKRKNAIDFRIGAVRVIGPLAHGEWVHPKNYELFFTRDEPPTTPEESQRYARQVLARFATRAYRRPVDDRTVERLLAIAGDFSGRPGHHFEESVARAMVAVLASPRFLFRVESAAPGGGAPSDANPLVDEYALASRLSYFLWSTMPDEELFRLAANGELRKNLPAQVERLLKDPRSDAMVKNFVGQWLQTRDVEGIAINAPRVLARDRGNEKEIEAERLAFRARLNDPKAQPKRPPRFLRPDIEFDGPLRRAMREETEMAFAHVVREDKSVLDLIDCDYTFVNERLAKHYGLPPVKGPAMRKVSLPEGHLRGGVLTHGSVLVVTSNPTRTSPVKRGLFLLDNILGTPAPPPPEDVPAFEDSEKAITNHEPTIRESMELHRSKPLCASCHARMDPLGLALENFNAMGMAREKERGQPIDPSGQLLTGESFKDVRALKRILTTERRGDFYRCLTEKLLTYALGRGVEDSDVESVDRIVDRMEREKGKFSALLTGIIESTPFQKTRGTRALAAIGTERARTEEKPKN